MYLITFTAVQTSSISLIVVIYFRDSSCLTISFDRLQVRPVPSASCRGTHWHSVPCCWVCHKPQVVQ